MITNQTINRAQREKLEADVKAKYELTPAELAENRDAEEKLQTAMALIVKLVGKEEMARLMVDDDDKKIMSAIQRKALRTPSSRAGSPSKRSGSPTKGAGGSGSVLANMR